MKKLQPTLIGLVASLLAASSSWASARPSRAKMG